MHNFLPKRILIGLEELPDEVKILEDTFNINLYNSELLEEIIKVLKYEDRARENIESYCNNLKDSNIGSDDYRNMILIIRTIALLLFDILKSHKLYIDNSLRYELLGIDRNKLFLKRDDIIIDNEILDFKYKEFLKYINNNRFNVGLFKFIKDYADK